MRLGDLVAIEKGRKPPVVRSSPEPGDDRLLQIDDLRADATPKYAPGGPGCPRARPTDVVLAWDGANAGTSSYGLRGLVGSTLATLSPHDPSILHTAYLGHFLASRRALLRSNCKGATVPHIDRAFLNALEVPLPPLNEQQHIVAILDDAGSLWAKRRKAMALLDELLDSVFHEIFGDPLSAPAKSMKLLPEVLERPIINGAYFPKAAYDGGDTEMVHMSDAFYGMVRRGSLRRVRASASDVAKYGASDKDLLVARRSLNFAGSGKACLLPAASEPLLFESSLIRLTPDESKVSVRYLYHYLNNDRVRAQWVLPRVTGATIYGINQQVLAALPVLVPSKEQLSDFDAVLGRIDKLRRISLEQQAVLDGLSRGLAAKVFKMPPVVPTGMR